METKHLSYFKVENFKRFDSLEVNDIGQFNLIVGDNNVGKTTLLEALLFNERNYDQFLLNLEFALENRELATDKRINYVESYLRNKNKSLNYTFQFTNSDRKNNLTVTKKNINQLSEKEIGNDILLQLKLNKSVNIVQIDLDGKSKIKAVTLFDENSNSAYYHFPLLGSRLLYDEETFNFTLTISASNSKLESFKSDLRFFLPDIMSIEEGTSAINGDTNLIIRETNSDNPLPLAAYGDGFIKFFRCLLKMELSTNKRLMIDEIDAGIHHSRMKGYLIQILQSAKNKNVQIFATTHSKECLQYYTEALQELGYENDGRVIKIANTKSGIKAYASRFGQFENSLSAESEIR